MFGKILVANRGEIACRIMRACQNLGIKTVAVYSEADHNSLHVKMADEAYLLGAAPPLESYLNMSRIISVARMSGAEAIHPGYGFLSQNPAFARACHDAEIRFVGPYPYVMENMGDKVKARDLAQKAGLPVLPGTNAAVDDCDVTSAAWQLGFPLMVKAAQGGGGIGIRVIDSLDGLASVIQQQRTLASNAFGSPQLYFERYMKGASHIEVQVLGDDYGNLVHLFARDCSVQRRNQKIVEESPVTKLTEEQRLRLWDYALKLARHIGYTSTGTVEFLVSPEGDAYFLEMNTRLQVEHGVTEMITGLDLVELQIRVAAGEPLPFKQEDIRTHGHAIEARIYPEDPETFMPSAGIIHSFHQPSGKHIRVDSALYPGYEVTTHYESLLAKLICWGETREDARKRLAGALDMFRIEGVKFNIPALKSIIAHSSFVDGTYHTGFLSSMSRDSKRDAENGVHALNGNGKRDKEFAAAIGVALLLSMNGNSGGNGSFRGERTDPWKLYGRRDQMLSRVLGSRGWR